MPAAGQQAASPADQGVELSKVAGISLRRSAPISPFESRGHAAGANEEDGQIVADSHRFSALESLKMLCHGDPDQVRFFGIGNLPDGYFDMECKVRPKRPELDKYVEAFQRLAEVYRQAFGVRIVWEERETKGLALRQGDGWEKSGLPAMPRDQRTGFYASQSMGFGVTARLDNQFNGEMGEFARYLEQFVDRPVLNETNLNGIFDFHWQHSPNTAAAEIGQYCAAHGLALVPTKCKVTAVFIEKADRKKN
jgi:uncharacterized protein (TIGR03435 family)